jgi:hypothetical protein
VPLYRALEFLLLSQVTLERDQASAVARLTPRRIEYVRTWTPRLPSDLFMMVLMDRLHPYIRTFDAAPAAVPDGIG